MTISVGTDSAAENALLEWCGTHDVVRVQLNAVDEARSLYERVGFVPPGDGLLELWLSRSPRSAG